MPFDLSNRIPMPYTPTPNDALLEQSIAAEALTQLNLISVFGKTGVTDFEDNAFNVGENVKIRRPKRRRAQSIDPRVAGATFPEAEYFRGEVTLEHLFVDGFTVYGHDPKQAASKYVQEVAQQTSYAIAAPREEYLYSKFRDWASIPTTGPVALGDHAPLAIVASISGADYAPMDNSVARNAQLTMDLADMPTSGKLNMVLSSKAKSDFLGDSTVLGFAGLTADAGNLINNGLRNGQFVERYGFEMTGSNVVSGQAAAGPVAGTAITAVPVVNPLFTIADTQTATPAGALDFTFGAAPAGFAVGKIAQIKRGTQVLGHGVILRVAGSVATLVPYNNAGAKMDAAQFAIADTIGVPFIPSVSPFYHEEALLIANRFILNPSEGSGARGVKQSDPNNGMTIQIITGGYDIARVREINAAYHMVGAKISDWRKAGLALTL
jgi:hypothetical protein